MVYIKTAKVALRLLNPLKTRDEMPKIKSILLVLIFISLFFTFIASSLLIPVIEESKSFKPCSLDYFRVAILSIVSSFIIQFSISFISSYTSLFKIWLEFLSILLASYPQKTEQFKTYSSWNLVKREAFLFGVFYNLLNLFIIIYNYYLQQELNDIEKFNSIESSEQEQLSSMNSKQATLSNIIKIRRNSAKNHHLADDTYDPESDPVQVIINYDSNSIEIANTRKPSVEYLLNNTDSGYQSFNAPVTKENGSVSSNKTTIISSLNALTTYSFTNIIIIMISSWLYEIGISLILSITFIYIPSLNDSYFTWIEKYYYNQIYRFLWQIVLPLFLVTQLFEKWFIYQHLTIKSLIIIALFSALLFAVGMVST